MIITKRVETAAEQEACFQIREAVFVTEQHVPLAMERDEYDGTALHFIALDGSVPIGTGRAVLKEGGRVAKIGRVAVAAAQRGRSVGQLLITTIETSPALRTVEAFVLDAQVHAIPFYQRLGYRATGDEFLDAGLLHCRMEKPNAYHAGPSGTA